jgi:ABC-type sugar transport system ATPase subunit
MVGRDIAPPAQRKIAEDRAHVLSARGVVVEHGAPPVDLDLYAGEVVGVAGMVGSGRSSLVRTIAGAISAASGTVTLDGRRVTIRKPADAIKLGICLIPEDRKNDGLLQPRSVAENISLASLDAVSRIGVVRSKLEQTLAAHQIKTVDIRPPNPAVRVDALSGGNQQKVVVGKWLARKPRVLILDEPTRGIDVGAKSEIHRTIRALAEDGVAVLMVSSELPEILSASDRILVMRDGAIVAELRPEDASEESILAYAVGHAGEEPPAGAEEQPVGSTSVGGA